jgi:hypothetical protein
VASEHQAKVKTIAPVRMKPPRRNGPASVAKFAKLEAGEHRQARKSVLK